MQIKTLQLWQFREPIRNGSIYCYIFWHLLFRFLYIFVIIVKSTMVSSNGLCYQWGNLRILLLCDDSPNIRMMRAAHHMRVFLIISSDALDIPLPLHLLLSLVMQESHNTSEITHAELRSKGLGSLSHILLMVVIRLNSHIGLPYMRYYCFRFFHILNSAKITTFFLSAK